MNIFYTVDRIESDFAIIECPDKSFITISLTCLPKDIKEGSILFKNVHSVYEIDKTEELKRKKANLELQNSIFNDK